MHIPTAMATHSWRVCHEIENESKLLRHTNNTLELRFLKQNVHPNV